ncbi:MAG: hypothetical protein Q9191_001783 [Dirinaria sp. TL-2023a]
MPPAASSNQSPRKSPRSRKSHAGKAEVSVRAGDPATGSVQVADGEGRGNFPPHKTASIKRAKAITGANVNGVETVPESGGTKRKRKIVEEREVQVDGSTPKKAKGSKRVKEEDHSVQQDGTISPTRKGSIKTEVKEEKREVDTLPTKPPKKKTKAQTKTPVNQEAAEESAVVDGSETTKKSKVNKTAKVKPEAAEGDEEGDGEGETPKKPIRKRKTKEEKEAEAMPLAARTVGLNMFVGAHVSCAKGVHNTVTNCLHIGGNAFAMFLKSQRKWENPPLQDEHRDRFRHLCGQHTYDAASHVLPHGSYLVNLAQEDPGKHAQAYDTFLDDLHRCEALGIKLYNFHPGWTGPTATRSSALTRIAASLNRAISATSTVTPVLETMAGSGSVIGSTFSDLASIIEQIKDKSRVGVCIDTCHIFAAGYDLRTPASFSQVMDEFGQTVGFNYLKALHLNDSKAPFGSHRDLHANIGTGFLGLRAFHNVMNEKRFEGLPMVLETPIDQKDPENPSKTIEDKTVWAKEIKMLESLIGMDIESQAFRSVEAELNEVGRLEREKHLEQYERKLEKEAKAAEKAAGKGKKKMNKEAGQGKQTTLTWRSAKVVEGERRAVMDESSGSELSSVGPSD